MKRQKAFVHVAVLELARVDAVLAIPACQAERLIKAGFIDVLADGGLVAQTGGNPWTDPEDMFLQVPGAFVVRL